METQAALTADQAQLEDEQRTKRLFVGFLSSVLGVDQLRTTDDNNANGSTGQFMIANPDGTYSALGRSVSNQQSTVASSLGVSPGLLLLAGLAWFLLRR